jgi:putative nucleotidyltransferase with HDIG domain
MSHSLLPHFKRRKRRAIRAPLFCSPINARRCALGVGTVLVLSVLMSIHFLPDRISVRLGDRSPTEIRATRSVNFNDTEATQRRREDAAERVPHVYDPDHSARAQAARAVSQVFEQVRRIRADNDTLAARKPQRLAGQLGGIFSPPQIRYLLVSPLATLDRLQNSARRLVEDAMAKEIRSDTEDLAHVKEDLMADARRTVSTPMDAGVLKAVGENALRPNLLFNRRRTEQQRERAMREIPPVVGEVLQGDVVIRQGEVVTQQHLDKFTAMGLISPRIDMGIVASLVAMAAAMVFLVSYYIRRNYPAIYNSTKLLFLLASTVILSVFGLKIFGTLLGIPLSYVHFGYLGMMTVVAAGMLITVLLNAPLAVLVTALLSAQSGLIMNHEIRLSVMYLISSLVGIYSASNIRARAHLLRATAAVGATNLALVWVLGGLLGDTLPEVVTGSGWAVLAAVLSIAIFWFGVAVLEKPFGILTHVWLLELSSSEHPLLRQLCLTAPGTYAHSIMVGNLAEAGAEAIGADTLFCRVASYYHDVGKMRRPHCFIENQRGENIHDRLNPSLSALIIASHVRDGLEMADEHRLPQQLRAVIAEHHGTSLIRYFYHQAVAGGSGCAGQKDPILEQHFRYDGPRPQTREAGIIMLADSIEAAARCLGKPSPARIQGLVETIIHDKLSDGQLDECDLTFKDIRKIQAAFVRILSGMLHNRIDYPELPRPGGPLSENEQDVLPRARLEGAKPAIPNGGLYPELTEAPREDEALAGGRADDPAF